MPSPFADRAAEVLQTGGQLGDRFLSGGLLDFGVSGAVDEDHPAGDLLLGIRINEVVTLDGQFVVFQGQGGGTAAAALLLQGQVTGLWPEQVRAVFLVEATEVIPGGRAQDAEALPLAAGDMASREGAAIGDH